MTAPHDKLALREELSARVMRDVEFDPNGGCWLWSAAALPKGYGTFGLRGQPYRAHRASYEAHIGPIPDGLFVCHRCDVPACVNPQHLWLGTNDDNMADMNAKGRRRGPEQRRIRTYGQDACTSKITDEQASEIRSSTEMTGVLAARYGISKSQVYNIRTGKQRTKDHLGRVNLDALEGVA